MDLRKLRHVCALAHTRSYVRAAKQLHITQSALSRSIQSLEKELQLKIFDRGRTGVHVTAAGRLLVEGAEGIIFATHNLQHDLALVNKGELGAVSFGVGPLPSSIVLPSLLTTLAIEHRNLRVRVEINDAKALLESLYAERIEFCICTVGRLEVSNRAMMTSLATLPIALYVRSGHPLASRLTLTPRDILKFPFLSSTVPTHGMEQLKASAGLRADETFPISISCDDYLVLKSVVLNSEAVLMTSAATVAAEIADGSILPLAATPLHSSSGAELKIVSLKGRTLSPAAELVIGKLRSYDWQQSLVKMGKQAPVARKKRRRKQNA